MNLIQVQERLKGLPPGPQTQQLLIAYANGMNTAVPPYLALGEIQRRNKLEQEQEQVEPPTGTVKDQLEQQAGLAALQNMRMQQGQQQMMQGAAAQPMPVPEGAPQPEMQPEATGIANAAAQPGVMQPKVLSMAGGGIVAFADAGEVDEDEDDEDEDEEGEEGVAEEPGATSLPVEAQPASNFRDLESLPVDEQPVLDAKTREGLASLGVTPFAPPSQAQAPQPQAPQGPQSTAQQLAGLQALAAQRRAAAPQAPQMATRESMAAQDPAMYGVLNKPVGGAYLAGLQALMAKQGVQDEAARKQLEANKRMDFYKALVAAGEGTRGQRGGLGSLGGLGAGFTKSIAPSMEARAQEAAGIDAAAIKRGGLFEKAKFDIEELQRAQGNNDLKTVNAQRAKLFDTAVKAYVSGNAGLAREIAAIAGIEEKKITAAAQVEAARIRAAAKGQGGADKRTDLDKQYQIELDALLASGEPDDAATRKRAMNTAQDRISKSAAGYRAETTAQEKADAWVQMQLLTGPRARELRALRTKDPAAYKKALEELEAEGQNRYVRQGGAPAPRPAPSTAPRGTKDNPIKLD
jgi:hypothetical protein